MKRLSVEEAKQYIPIKEDYLSEGIEKVKYFTLTPKGNGWEKVTYFTGRKVNRYYNVNGDYDSWVYILSNPTQPGLLKIGYTRLNPEERAKQISKSTGVALPYNVEWAFNCFNGFMLEQEIHKMFEGYRINSNREFFEIPLEEAKISIKKLGERYI